VIKIVIYFLGSTRHHGVVIGSGRIVGCLEYFWDLVGLFLEKWRSPYLCSKKTSSIPEIVFPHDSSGVGSDLHQKKIKNLIQRKYHNFLVFSPKNHDILLQN